MLLLTFGPCPFCHGVSTFYTKIMATEERWELKIETGRSHSRWIKPEHLRKEHNHPSSVFCGSYGYKCWRTIIINSLICPSLSQIMRESWVCGPSLSSWQLFCYLIGLRADARSRNYSVLHETPLYNACLHSPLTWCLWHYMVSSLERHMGENSDLRINHCSSAAKQF